MANSMHFNSVDLSSATYGVTVEHRDLPLFPFVNVDETNLPYGFGGMSQGAYTESYPMAVPVTVIGSSAANLKTKLDALALLLYQRMDSLTTLKFDTSSDRYWNVRFKGISDAARKGVAVQCTLNFAAPDPRAYATSATNQSAGITSNPDTVTVPADGVVAGSAPADPVIYVRNSSGDTVSGVIVNNTTRSETLTFGGSLDDTYWLKIDCTPTTQRCYRSTNTGDDPTILTYTEVMGGVSGDFPLLDPGVANSFTVTALSAGTFKIVYRARYFGGA